MARHFIATRSGLIERAEVRAGALWNPEAVAAFAARARARDRFIPGWGFEYADRMAAADDGRTVAATSRALTTAATAAMAFPIGHAGRAAAFALTVAVRAYYAAGVAGALCSALALDSSQRERATVRAAASVSLPEVHN